MSQQIVAHTQLPQRHLRTAQLWEAIHAQGSRITVHSDHARDYFVGAVCLRIRMSAGVITAVWAAPTGVLTQSVRHNLEHACGAWVKALTEVGAEVPACYVVMAAVAPVLSSGVPSVNLISQNAIAAKSEAQSSSNGSARIADTSTESWYASGEAVAVG